jgi:hypothetical protein
VATGDYREELLEVAGKMEAEATAKYAVPDSDLKERARLEAEGFDWSKEEFKYFVSTLEEFGRYEVDKLVSEMEEDWGKTADEVKRYYIEFMWRYARTPTSHQSYPPPSPFACTRFISFAQVPRDRGLGEDHQPLGQGRGQDEGRRAAQRRGRVEAERAPAPVGQEPGAVGALRDRGARQVGSDVRARMASAQIDLLSLTPTLLSYRYSPVEDQFLLWAVGEFGAEYVRAQRGGGRRRGGSMMTYKTPWPYTIMRVAGSATSAMRKPQNNKRVRNDEA